MSQVLCVWFIFDGFGICNRNFLYFELIPSVLRVVCSVVLDCVLVFLVHVRYIRGVVCHGVVPSVCLEYCH